MMRVIKTLAAFLAVGAVAFVTVESYERYRSASDGERRLEAATGEVDAAASPAEMRPAGPDYGARLDAYPSHGEWVRYAAQDGAEITGYVAFPERSDPAPAMIVIHEIYGMSDFVRSITHELAEAGYVALAPDLLSRVGGTEGPDEARTAIRDLPPEHVTMDLDATKSYLRSLASVEGEAIGVIGFCWGGSQSFRYATDAPDLEAVVVCYGGAPDPETMAGIEAPVLGVYAENDARINSSLPEVASAMREAGKSFTYEIYPGANHGFLRSRNVPEEADRAWADILAFLERELDN